MEKRIRIYRGEEYRPKTERAFEADDFFAEVYLKAGRIVKEIAAEMREYENEMSKSRRYAVRYSDMGNNILIFCGKRGQGKTSAMKSFARLLENGYREEELPEELKDTISEIRQDWFEVIDPIDPSAMENDESILRVLLSRLFYQLQERFRREETAKDKNELMRIRAEITKLFRRCYENIDYIKYKKGGECDQDDLEALSGLGSSAKLKENLHGLIEEYMGLAALGKEKGKKGFLVVPIDDADLATKKVFRLCEDIRNYLSVPNVIILLATDYEQLINATYQRYLKQHKIRRQVDCQVFHTNQVTEDCYMMAARYLEKVFPVGHRIDLPQIDDLLAEGHEKVKFDYIIHPAGGKREFDLAFERERLEECNDIQGQLLRLLYFRTGIILKENEENMHAFLPHTFRELTHFVKLLYDMNPVSCDEIYEHYQRSQENTEELEREIRQLKENIAAVKRYFINYWCEKNLNVSEVAVIREIDDASQKRQTARIYKSISKRLLTDERYKGAVDTYRQILQYLVGEHLSGHPEFQEAFHIYYTIFFNEWFAAALENEKQFSSIARFIETPLRSSFGSGLRYKKSYHVFQLVVRRDALQKYLGSNINTEVRDCLESCCIMEKNAPLFEETEGNIQWNDDISKVKFDLLYPILTELTKNREKEIGDGEEEDTVTDREESIGQIRRSHLIGVRNILANYDVQKSLECGIINWFGKINAGRKTKLLWLDFCKILYNEIDSLLYTMTGLEQRKDIADICGLYFGKENEALMTAVFLCEPTNQKKYTEQKKAEMEGWMAQVQNVKTTWDVQTRNFEEIDRLLNEYDTVLTSGIVNWTIDNRLNNIKAVSELQQIQIKMDKCKTELEALKRKMPGTDTDEEKGDGKERE